VDPTIPVGIVGTVGLAGLTGLQILFYGNHFVYIVGLCPARRVQGFQVI